MDPRRKKWQLVKLSFCTFGTSAHLGGKCCHENYVDEWIWGARSTWKGRVTAACSQAERCRCHQEWARAVMGGVKQSEHVRLNIKVTDQESPENLDKEQDTEQAG